MNHFEEHKYDIKNETVFAPFTKGLLGTVNTNTIKPHFNALRYWHKPRSFFEVVYLCSFISYPKR